jgi:hypothetical protein
VDHPVSVKGVVTPQGLVDGVLGVAKVDALDVLRDSPFQDLRVRQVDLLASPTISRASTSAIPRTPSTNPWADTTPSMATA